MFVWAFASKSISGTKILTTKWAKFVRNIFLNHNCTIWMPFQRDPNEHNQSGTTVLQAKNDQYWFQKCTGSKNLFDSGAVFRLSTPEIAYQCKFPNQLLKADFVVGQEGSSPQQFFRGRRSFYWSDCTTFSRWIATDKPQWSEANFRDLSHQRAFLKRFYVFECEEFRFLTGNPPTSLGPYFRLLTQEVFLFFVKPRLSV